MTVTLRLTEDVHDRLLAMATNDVESGAVLIAKRVVVSSDRTVLLGLDLVDVPDEAYEMRTPIGLQITSEGYVHALKEARHLGAIAIWVHSHPGDGSRPVPSAHDEVVNTKLAELFASRTGSDAYGYLIVGHDRGLLTYTGAITGADSARLDQMAVVGSRWRFLQPFDIDRSRDRSLFDRNIRAFGEGIQSTIGALEVAIIGCGGTGSAVAEQLVRLGVRRLILIDPDTLSLANTTRVYGSSPRAVGRAKVDVLAEHLQAIADGVSIDTIQGTILDEQTARKLVAADVVFGCTDDNAGRLRLSRLPAFYLTPVIDCGVQIDSGGDGLIRGIFGRVTTLYPGSACLVCRDRIDLARADAEMRSHEEQAKLEKEGYAPALGGTEPAVVAYTTMVAATSVGEFLERLVGFGEDPSPTELILRVHDREIRANSMDPRPGHYCDPSAHKLGTDSVTFLEMNWIS